jgi:hypothetical protein
MELLPPSRREALFKYLTEVTRDLAMRGAIRWKRGQPFDVILRAEGETILREVAADLTAVAGEIGVGLLGGLQNMGMKWLSEKIAGSRK